MPQDADLREATGLAVEHLDTPALFLDLDAFEHNLATINSSMWRWPWWP